MAVNNKEVKYCFTNQYFRTLSRKNNPQSRQNPDSIFYKSRNLTSLFKYTVDSTLFEKAWPQTFMHSSDELSRENTIRAGKRVFEISFFWQPSVAAKTKKSLKIKCFISQYRTLLCRYTLACYKASFPNRLKI